MNLNDADEVEERSHTILKTLAFYINRSHPSLNPNHGFMQPMDSDMHYTPNINDCFNLQSV